MSHKSLSSLPSADSKAYYYYYYRKANQKDLIKSLVASGNGERLLNVEEIMTSS